MSQRVGAVIEGWAERFARAGLTFGHGTDNAWDEAVVLVLGVAGLPDDRAVLEQELSAEQEARIAELGGRRIREHVPVAYLLGRTRFAGLEFYIEPGVVIPRSPLGGMLLDGLTPWITRAPDTILDLCCGNGCIGIVAATVFPEARVDLVDVEATALELARRNVALHGLEDRVRVRQSDLFDDLPPGRWDLIVSNPPYVDAADMAGLPLEHRHEPASGLAGGEDGLEVVARMLDALPERLEPDGTFVCEVGNSAAALTRRWPDVAFIWPDDAEGVFVILSTKY
ncbi:MAG: 50S ribosomal protein L3 N(5)-glutamine methyltransferase [Pseudomonadota bacterium]